MVLITAIIILSKTRGSLLESTRLPTKKEMHLPSRGVLLIPSNIGDSLEHPRKLISERITRACASVLRERHLAEHRPSAKRQERREKKAALSPCRRFESGQPPLKCTKCWQARQWTDGFRQYIVIWSVDWKLLSFHPGIGSGKGVCSIGRRWKWCRLLQV